MTIWKLRIRLPPALAHRIATHLDAVSIVDLSIQYAIGQCWVADLLVPVCNRQLGGQNGRPRLVTILADLPEVASFGFRQRGHGPVADDQDIDAAESREQTSQAAV